MSYILDALKKSEKERKQGDVPNLNSIQDGPPPRQPSNRPIVYLIIAVLVVSIIGINLWVLFHKSSDQPQEGQTTASTSEAPEGDSIITASSGNLEPTEKEPADQAQPADTAESEAAAQIDAGVPEKPGTPSQETVQPESQNAAAESTEKSGDEAIPSTVQAEVTPGSPPETDEVTGEAEHTIAAVEESDAISPPSDFGEDQDLAEDQFESELDEQPLDSEDKDDKKIIVAYKDLPGKIRNAMPELSIAAHFYSKNPSARMASINGRIVRQGQKIANGLTLEEIYDEGIICSYGNYRFRLKVFNP